MRDPSNLVFLGPLQRQFIEQMGSLDVHSEASAVPAGNAFLNLVAARMSAGLKTTVITLTASAKQPVHKVERNELAVWVVRQRPTRVLRDAYREERRLIQEVLQDLQPDLCHAHWTYEYAASALDYSPAQTLVTVHDHAGHMLRWSNFRYLALYRMTMNAFKRAHGLTAVSPYVQRYAARKSGLPVATVPNLLNPDLLTRDQPRAASEPGGILFLGQWSPLKNPKKLLQAYALLRRSAPTVPLRVAGKGMGPGGPGEQWARKNGLEQGVQFLGPRPYAEVFDLLSSAGVLAHLSREESFGLPLMEAMYLHVPTIAHQGCEASRWLLKDGALGELTDGENPSLIAASLLHAMKLPEETRAQARAHIEELCHPSRVLPLYEQCYQKLCGKA
jgi:glycosyltransferase involved in cell wall biosynthesis